MDWGEDGGHRERVEEWGDGTGPGPDTGPHMEITTVLTFASKFGLAPTTLHAGSWLHSQCHPRQADSPSNKAPEVVQRQMEDQEPLCLSLKTRGPPVSRTGSTLVLATLCVALHFISEGRLGRFLLQDTAL